MSFSRLQTQVDMTYGATHNRKISRVNIRVTCQPSEILIFLNSGSRPISRVLSRVIIPLGCVSPHISSDLPESRAGYTLGFLFGLAPGGVYHAVGVTTNAVRSYRTFSPLPTISLAVYFLWHCPSARAAQRLSGTLPFGARTFLDPVPQAT